MILIGLLAQSQEDQLVGSLSSLVKIIYLAKKQTTVSLSSAEAEYRSMRRVCAELSWLSRLLNELEVPNVTPIPLKCDNMAAIYIAKNPVFHERTKHIDLDCHFVRENYRVV